MQDIVNDGKPFTSAEALLFGFTRHSLDCAVVEGRLRRLFRGMYVDAKVPDSRMLRLKAIKIVRPPEAVVCNETASWLMGVDTFKPSDRHLFDPSFVVPHSSTRITVPGARCRQAIVKSRDITFIDGIPVTAPLRTTSDLLRRLYRPYALAAADGMARAGLIQVNELWEFVAALKGYPGIVQARSLAFLVDPRAASPGESWQRLRIHDAGFPPPEPQFEVIDDFGNSRFLDLAYPDLLIGSEYDGREFHTARAHQEHDEERRNYLSDVYGWRWANADRDRLFGPDTSFERELAKLLRRREWLPRRWGY